MKGKPNDVYTDVYAWDREKADCILLQNKTSTLGEGQAKLTGRSEAVIVCRVVAEALAESVFFEFRWASQNVWT